MLSISDLRWLAGLLEGEGCFLTTVADRKYSYPRISLGMTDLDVVERVASLMGSPTIRAVAPKDSQHKTQYHFEVHKGAAGWMMTLYPLMGKRRQAKIRECLAAWKNSYHHKKVNDNGAVRAGIS